MIGWDFNGVKVEERRGTLKDKNNNKEDVPQPQVQSNISKGDKIIVPSPSALSPTPKSGNGNMAKFRDVNRNNCPTCSNSNVGGLERGLNGTRTEYLEPHIDLTSTQRLDLYLDSYEQDFGLEPVNLDKEVYDLMPKIEALVSLINRRESQSQTQRSQSQPLSSSQLSTPTEDTVIGQDEVDKNVKAQNQNQPQLFKIKGELKDILRTQNSLKGATDEQQPSTTLRNNNDIIRGRATPVRNIDTQQKISGRYAVNNTEVGRDNEANCDKKTSTLHKDSTKPVTSASTPQSRPPPQHIDNSRRNVEITTGNVTSSKVYDGSLNPLGKYENNQTKQCNLTETCKSPAKSSPLPRNIAFATNNNTLQQVQHPPPTPPPKKTVRLQENGKPEVPQNNNKEANLSPQNALILTRFSPGNLKPSLKPQGTASHYPNDAFNVNVNELKHVAPFKILPRLSQFCYDSPDEISTCLDLIDGLSFHTTWIMKKVLEFPASHRDASERLRRLRRSPEIGDFFGVPYVKNEVMGHYCFSPT